MAMGVYVKDFFIIVEFHNEGQLLGWHRNQPFLKGKRDHRFGLCGLQV
jgi:hypothetical protein